MVCEHGVIGTGQGGKQTYWVPHGTWREKSANLTVSERLKQLSDEIKTGTLNEKDHETTTLAKAQEKILGHKLNGRGLCKCKNRICGGNCGCRRNNKFCNSSCGCGGNCQYTESLFQPDK